MTFATDDAPPAHPGDPSPGVEAAAIPGGRPRVLCILAAPRTGSTLLCRVLACDPAFLVRGELFHPSMIRNLADAESEVIARRAGSAEAIAPWRAGNPGALVDLLLAMHPPCNLVMKVFPGHVEARLLRDEILRRRDVAIVVLTRRPIDSFISAMKARHFGAHYRVDTTEYRPELDAAEFVRWARLRREWYRWVDETLGEIGVTPVRIGYESSLMVDPWSTARDVAVRSGLAFQPGSRESMRLVRQDRTESFRDRVTHWEAFAAAADPDLLEWAVGEVSPTSGGR